MGEFYRRGICKFPANYSSYFHVIIEKDVGRAEVITDELQWTRAKHMGNLKRGHFCQFLG